MPSVFAGIQLPGGINIKARYYLTDFLNSGYSGNNSSGLFDVSDLTRYKSTQNYYISISWQFNSEHLRNKNWHKDGEVAYKDQL